MYRALFRDLQAAADPVKAAFFPRFFKAGPGQYAEGDRFIGVTVPQTRTIAKAYRTADFSSIERMLADPIHEVRLAGLFILVLQYEKSDDTRRQEIVDFYLSHLNGVNNWDLVDSSAYQILGRHLLTRDRSLLDQFAKINDLWTQRIAIVATLAFIREGQIDDTFRIALLLMNHSHDLIHKAVGWMLREAGKKDEAALRAFLDQHALTMPRTMLRYAIEKFEEPIRKQYLAR